MSWFAKCPKILKKNDSYKTLLKSGLRLYDAYIVTFLVTSH